LIKKIAKGENFVNFRKQARLRIMFCLARAQTTREAHKQEKRAL